MIKQACFARHKLTKATYVFILSILLATLTLTLSPPPETYANGPIPFLENFDTFSGSGFAPAPGAGQLDSDVWIVTGFSDGSLAFGDTQTSSSDFARGSSTGGVTTGGIYAFDAGSGNIILGVQPIGTDFTPGEIILRLQNNTGSTITQLDVSYDVWYRNDQARANSLNFSHSPDDVTYTPIAALDFTTPETADALGWQPAPRSTTLTGLNIANGDFFYLKWTGDDVSGSGSRDEYGIDNVQVTTGGDTPPSITNTTPTNGTTGVAIDANIDLNFSEAVTWAGNWFQIVCGSSGTYNVIDTVVTGGPINWTIDPNTDFTNGETCTVTVFAAQVTDQDGTPENMAADYVFNFTTVAAVSGWVINEIHADPDGALGDANGDGTVGIYQDEFIEVVNNTGSTVDISGWTLADGIGMRHTFPGGTVVPDQCAVVVFDGGTPTGAFGGATVQTASTGQLSLNNDGDTITLNDGAADQAVYPYGSEGGDNQSLTRDPDITGPDPLIKHSLATGSGGSLFSPGTRIDGSLFSGCIVPDIPPTVTATTPPNGAMDVAITTTIDIQFSEIVTTTASAFALECPIGTPIVPNVAPIPPGNASNFTLTPSANLPNGTLCTVTAFAIEVTDQDVRRTIWLRITSLPLVRLLPPRRLLLFSSANFCTMA